MQAADVEVRILDDRLRLWGLPRYQTDMSAAVDLFACLAAPLLLRAGSPAHLVPSGMAIHLANANLAAVIAPRSGAGHRKGLVLGNGIGIIDADYMGELLVSAWNRNPPGGDDIEIQPGERIAQMLFIPVVRATLREVAAFSDTSARGTGGFGSTGAGTPTAGPGLPVPG